MRAFSQAAVEHPNREALVILLIIALLCFDGYWLTIKVCWWVARAFGPLGWAPEHPA